MPQAAIPAALPYVLGGLGIAQMVQSNVANKATIKNAENASNNANKQVGMNQDAAMQRLGQYNQQNQGPAAPGAAAHPIYSGTQIPIVGQQPQQHMTQMQGGMDPSAMSGSPGGGMLSQLSPQQIQALIAHLGNGAPPQGGGMA